MRDNQNFHTSIYKYMPRAIPKAMERESQKKFPFNTLNGSGGWVWVYWDELVTPQRSFLRPFFTMVYPCGVIPNEVRDLLFCR